MFLERETLNSNILCWLTSLTERKLPRQCTKSMEVYADKARKIKSAYHCISLNSCDLFLSISVYIQE